MNRSKTIQIFLKDSEADGVKIADLSNSIVRVYVIPRDQMAFARERADLNTPALYMLFDDERTSVYIGESENFNKRVLDHEAKKPFWQWAVVCISQGSGLDKADIKFLESHAVTLAVGAGRYEVLNKTAPNVNNLHEFKQEAIKDYFSDVELLVSTLGFNVFDAAKEESVETPVKPMVDERQYDTIVCPGDHEGYVEAFVGSKAWWSVRIGKANLMKLKYLAIYQSAPVSAIVSYAKITDIEPIADMPGKYKIHHDGNIIELKPRVVLGPNSNLSLQASRYFKLEDIKSSKDLTELTKKTFS